MASSSLVKCNSITASRSSSTVLIWILLLVGAATSVSGQSPPTAEPEVNQPRNVEDQVSPGLIPTFRMANFFLNDIVQTNYLTDLAKKIPMATIDDFTGAFPAQWSDAVVYGIGFVVCFAIGIVSTIGFLLAALIFPCCRGCGRCGSKVPEEMASDGCCRRSGRKSRCCTWTMQVFLALASVGLILGNIPMYVVNEQFYPQLKTDFFVDVNSSMTGLDRFIKKIPFEIEQAVVVEFDVMETSIMGKLNSISDGVITAINNETGVVTALNGLQSFTSNLTELNTTMAMTSQTAAQLQSNPIDLDANFSVVTGQITTQCGNSTQCTILLDLLSTVNVGVNFSLVLLPMSAGQSAVSISLSEGIVGMVNNSVSQLDDVSTSVNQSISGSVDDVQANFDDASKELNNAINEINGSINQIDIDGARNTVMGGQEYTQLAADITYGVCLGLSIILSLIIAFNVLGLVFGIIFPPHRNQNGKRGKCRRDKSVGSHLLMVSVVLTLIFYWFYMLMTAVLFVAGGAAETEACRHLINYEDSKSKAVLGIFDGWANSSLYGQVQLSILPFVTYSQCSSNATIYKAMSLDEKWNVTELTNTDKIDDALDEMKAVQIDIPTVNLTNNALNSTLLTLDSALSPRVLNFTTMYIAIDGTVFVPDLTDVIKEMENVNSAGIDLTTQITEMNSILNASRELERKRDQLVKDLQYIQHYVGQANFAQDAAILGSATVTINQQGEMIVSKYVNDTADGINNDVTAYATKAAYGVENTVANCRPVYDDATTLIDSFCVQSIYLINGWWYSLGWCLAFLVPSLVLAIHLETVYRYTSTTSTVSHMDSSISANGNPPDDPEIPPPSYDAANRKDDVSLEPMKLEQPEQQQSKPVPPPTKPKPKPKNFEDIPEPDY